MLLQEGWVRLGRFTDDHKVYTNFCQEVMIGIRNDKQNNLNHVEPPP